jgi:hypothetical protein
MSYTEAHQKFSVMKKQVAIAAIRARELKPDQAIIAESRHLSDNSAGLDECATGDLRDELWNDPSSPTGSL